MNKEAISLLLRVANWDIPGYISVHLVSALVVCYQVLHRQLSHRHLRAKRKGRPRPRARCVPYFAHIKSDTISYINPELIQTPAAINIFRLDVYQLCSLSRHANRYIGRTYYHSHCTSVNTSAQIPVIAQGSLRSTIHRPLQLAHFQPMRLLHRFFHYLHAEDVMNIYI